MEYTQDGFGSNQSLDSKVQKLVILFVFDKMAIPLAETTLLDICSSDNNWLSYMECKQYLAELLDTNLVYRVPKSDMLGITQDGVSCLSLFFTKIPSSIRDEIVEYARENRMRFKKRQSYFCDYSKNADGTYTVRCIVLNGEITMFELKFNVPTKAKANSVAAKWQEAAPEVYRTYVEMLID